MEAERTRVRRAEAEIEYKKHAEVGFKQQCESIFYFQEAENSQDITFTSLPSALTHTREKAAAAEHKERLKAMAKRKELEDAERRREFHQEEADREANLELEQMGADRGDSAPLGIYGHIEAHEMSTSAPADDSLSAALSTGVANPGFAIRQNISWDWDSKLARLKTQLARSQRLQAVSADISMSQPQSLRTQKTDTDKQ